MRARVAEFDWGATELGPVEGWPASLRITTALVLGSGFPMILVWGPGRIQIYNDAYVPLIGRKHPAALGRPTHEVWPEIRHLQEPIFERVYGGETVNLVEAYYRLARQGEVEDLYFDATFVPVPLGDPDGPVGGSVSTLFDVTARRRTRALEEERGRILAESEASRERLARVFAQTPAAVGVLRGPEHVVESVNEMFLRLLGRKDYLGRPAHEAAPELEAQGFRALMDEVYRSGVPHFGNEARLVWDRAGDGTLVEGYFDFVYQPMTGADGEVEGILVFAVDVTAQVLARRALEEARAEAERATAQAEAANRAKSEFLAVMSHELRTPLNAIGGYAELLEMGIRGPVSEAQRADLDRIQQSQRHLLGLINEVLNYAKLETGTVRFQVEHVPVREALVAAELLVAPQARAKGLALTVEGCPADLAAEADAEKVRQILVNLLSNAVKFTDPGGRIRVSCAAAAATVQIRVSDTGIGISEDKLVSVFDPFVQVRSDLTRPNEGTGLGLAISRDLARMMGGDVTVESAPGRGSTFTLTLPRVV